MSVFCNQCGSPLAPGVQVASPAQPVIKRKNCPACGFGNFGENRFYCKQCGAYILKNEPVLKSESPGEERKRSPQEHLIRIKPDSMEMTRGKTSYKPQKRPGLPVTMEDYEKQRRSESFRKIAAAGTGIILLIAVIVILGGFIPGFLPYGTANTTVMGSAGPTGQGSAGTMSPAVATSPQIHAPVVPVTRLTPHQSSITAVTSPVPSPATIGKTVPSVTSSPPPWAQVKASSTPSWTQVTAGTTPPWTPVTLATTPSWSQVSVYTTPPWLQVSAFNTTPPWL